MIENMDGINGLAEEQQQTKKFLAADFAEAYLTSREYIGEEQRLYLWRSDFYKFHETHYIPIPRDEIKNDVVSWLQSSPDLREFAKTSSVNNIILNIDGITQLPMDVQLQSWLGKSPNAAEKLINVKNGILDIEAVLGGKETALLPHSPNFFSMACLPYDFDSTAKCPRWIKFLETMQPNESVRNLLQEWFGYNLVYDVRQEKFLLFVGEGANGKTVACVVLRTLLGDKNVSAVGLEAFSPTRTFPLAATVGKLANIVEELNEIDRASEGELKKFVSGGLMTVERKHKDPFEFFPTARLTFASNVLPRFADRTDGLWRRLFIVPFSIQIMNESDQDKRLIDAGYWQSSGELPGILNWALAGLARLRERQKFDEPEICKQAKTAFKKDANPAKTFLTEFCEKLLESQVSSARLYERYNEYTTSNGQRPLSESQFAQEVGRVFPEAVKSPNAVRGAGGVRSRVWQGIYLKDG